jgi:hypothetical protein
MTDTAPEATAPEADPQACRSCGTTSRSCIEGLNDGRGACCGTCSLQNTHGTTAAADGAELADVRGETPGTGVVQADGLQAALMAAAEAGAPATGIATIPAVSEFAHLCQVARLMSMSDLAPEKIRGRPYDALLIILTARDLGIPITSGLRKISVIEGQPSIDTELQLALVRQRGFGAVLPVEENFTQEVPLFAGAIAVGPSGGAMGPMVVFTWGDAITGGYVDEACLPNAHDRRRITKKRRDGSTYSYDGCGCKDNWKGSPRDMLWWRAAARARRIYFPEATTGMYDADELGGIIDVEGRLVDPTTAPLPDGYVDPGEQRREQAAAAEQRGDVDELLDLQLRIRALPTAVRDEMRTAWKENDRIQGRPPHALPQRLVKMAKAMITGWEASAKRADRSWDRDQARDQVREEVSYQIVELMHLGLVGGGMRLPAGTEAPPASEQEAIDTELDRLVDDVTAPQEPQELPEAEAGTPAAPEPTEAQGDDPGGAGDDADPEPEATEPDRDWDPELRAASAELARLVKEAAPYVADTIGQAVKGLSWQAVNKALEEAGLSTDGPIDLRRMRLSIHRFMEYEEPF